MKKENENQACQTGGCGCSVNHIWFGIAVVLLVMAIAVILSSYGF